MSFRLFVYYCAVGGAWSGLVGWILGQLLSPPSGEGYFRTILHTSMLGMFLGLSVALGLSFLDAVFSFSIRQFGKVLVRVFAAVLVGLFGGLFGSFVGGSLYYATNSDYEFLKALSFLFFVLGWTIVGLLIGLSICFFDIFLSMITRKDFTGAFRKSIKCLIGGAIGGVLGGLMAFGLKWLTQQITNKDVEQLWSPTALGFIAIGACIGLLVGLAQIILKEAWIKVEAGFRPGREMLLMKEKTSIGRAEGSDIALFGDSAVEKLHANIVLDSGRYYLEDLQAPGGTFINDSKVEGRAPLSAGDLIRVGKSVLRFHERAKRTV